MFDNLSDKLDKAMHVLKGHGQITEVNVAETLKEIRRALVDADVNYKIAKDFTNTVKEKALGQDVLTALKPGQLMTKLVKDELTELMGGEAEGINLSGNPSVILMSGLQGSGKTTFSGKLANFLKNKKTKKPLLVACDGNDYLVNNDRFEVTTKNYSESAFTCEFYSKVGNFSQAIQIFNDDNIFALLPLENNLVQVVLFCNKELKSFLKSTTDDQLKKYLKDKMKSFFSIDSEVKNLSEFQLKDKSLKSILYKRLITIGDAAHIIHPMAGQGFNLGLRDIRNLESLILKKTNFDIGSRSFLRKYERDRKKDVTQLSNLTALISNFTFKENKFNQKLKKNTLLSKSLSFAINSKLLKQHLIKQATL